MRLTPRTGDVEKPSLHQAHVHLPPSGRHLHGQVSKPAAPVKVGGISPKRQVADLSGASPPAVASARSPLRQ
jgi:hypothetical protein